MAPGPNLCRFERTSAERQTWRVGARSPGHHPGLSCFSGPAASDRLELVVRILEDGDLQGDQPLCLAKAIDSETVADGDDVLADRRVDIAGKLGHADLVPRRGVLTPRRVGRSRSPRARRVKARRYAGNLPSDAGVRTSTGAVTAPSLQPAVEDRVVEVDVAERAAQQLKRVAGQRVGVLLVDAELLGDSDMTLAEAERHYSCGAFRRRQRGECFVEPGDELFVRDTFTRAHVVGDRPGGDRPQSWAAVPVGGHAPG